MACMAVLKKVKANWILWNVNKGGETNYKLVAEGKDAGMQRVARAVPIYYRAPEQSSTKFCHKSIQ